MIVLEQLLTLWIRKGQPFGQVLIITGILLLIATVVFYFGKKLGLLGNKRVSEDEYRWLWIGLGLVSLFAVQIIGKMILVIEKGQQANTVNQSAILGVGMHPILLVTLVGLVAPIVEEIVFRGLLYDKSFGPSYIGLMFSSFMFGLIHVPTDFGSWIIYVGMGLILGLVYRKTQKLEHVMLVHFLNNGIALILITFVTKMIS
ncbi:membrane-bound protease CAAX family [Streptococcus dysgalactiae subsp. dysgalactiae]|uniref:Membrane-bound protease CAAX family n=1 Tax=Streptococcus dysgalactiae subsp. dysgalactiae TaxID=99822 RepID=A0A380K0Y2_STRDY|nr:CPBP family intramembrane glutamic endopeptidase [Streptococcus dysgalactiae]SUN51836.1 membrane-bound protease CAAX family [Streptococcus dysgalactiae subsp. dysgalactiae]